MHWVQYESIGCNITDIILSLQCGAFSYSTQISYPHNLIILEHFHGNIISKAIESPERLSIDFYYQNNDTYRLKVKWGNMVFSMIKLYRKGSVVLNQGGRKWKIYCGDVFLDTVCKCVQICWMYFNSAMNYTIWRTINSRHTVDTSRGVNPVRTH